ncbi:MAG: NAD(P)/FAD-dependent oxidoreductase, partial [Bacteroidia bacterium]
MQKTLQFQVAASVAFNEQLLRQEAAQHLQLKSSDQFHIKILKRSIDARSRHIKANVTLQVFVNELPPADDFSMHYRDVSSSAKTCTIIGAGPAGLFAALKCLELGVKPVIFERGKDVKSRRRDLAAINKEHLVNPESNYCFGEGGAGTYSDGKLYTRSGKRGDIDKILRTLVFHGASPEILIDAHPHIGTNKLPKLVAELRESIKQAGGEVHFQTRVSDFVLEGNELNGVCTQQGDVIQGRATLLATGHSAREIFQLLNDKKILIEA